MILHIYSYATYISEPEKLSREGGYFFVVPKPSTPITETPQENRLVHAECSIIRNVMESSTEEELGELFEKCQKVTSMRATYQKWATNNHQHQWQLTSQQKTES